MDCNNRTADDVEFPPTREVSPIPPSSFSLARGVSCSPDSVFERHYLTPCMAQVKQVRQRTYPSMVLLPSLYKIGFGLAAADEV